MKNFLEPNSVLDSSSLTDFLRCPRMFLFRHVFGWRSQKVSNHLVFGSAYHKAMEHIILNKPEIPVIAEAYQIFLEEYRKSFPPETDNDFHPKSPENALKSLVEYCKHYSQDWQKYRVLYTEISGKVPISPDLSIHFRMDTIMEDQEGRIFSLEHKTGSTFSQHWLNNWVASIAVGTYTHVLNSLYGIDKVRGIKINGIFFQKKENKFERHLIVKNRLSMLQWLNNLYDWYDSLTFESQQLLECSPDDEILRAFPLNVTSCTDYFGCPYFNICDLVANPLSLYDPNSAPDGFVIEFWDPRLEDTRNKKEITKPANYEGADNVG